MTISSFSMAQNVAENRLKMAGAEKPYEDISSAEPVENLPQNPLTIEQQQRKIIMDYIEKSTAFKDPALIKRMYSAMRGLDDTIQKAHEESLKKLEDNPEELEKEKQKLDEQTPFRFNFKAQDTQLLTQEINKNPQNVAAQILMGFKTPNINERTIDVQRNQIERMNKQFADKMGMSVQEYQDLLQQQQEIQNQKKLPGTYYDLTHVILDEQ